MPLLCPIADTFRELVCLDVKERIKLLDIDLDLDKKVRVVAVVDSQDSLAAVVDAVVDMALILLKVRLN